MLNVAYTNYGGYFWMLAIALVTYLVMGVVKKTFTPFTKKLSENDKERTFANEVLGVVLCAGIGLALGKFGNMLFATDVYFMWFIGGGVLANYANLLVRKFKDADSHAFASAFIKAMNESNMPVTEADLPTLTEEMGAIVKAYADSNENSRKSKLRGVAAGITNSVEITDDERKELERAIDKLKSAGLDTTAVDKAFAQAKADGKITKDEKANLEAVIRAIHNATNI